jgi:hypothetical protein
VERHTGAPARTLRSVNWVRALAMAALAVGLASCNAAGAKVNTEAPASPTARTVMVKAPIGVGPSSPTTLVLPCKPVSVLKPPSGERATCEVTWKFVGVSVAPPPTAVP